MFNWLKSRTATDSLLAICPGSGGVAAAQVRREGDRAPSLVWAQYADEDDVPRSLERLGKARQVHNVACTTLANIGEYSLLLVDKPDVPAAELKQAIRWQVKDLVDFPVEDAVVDVFAVPTAAGERLYAVVARAATIRDRIEQIEKAGFALRAVDIPELAIRNLAALLPEDTGGVGFIYLGARSGLITITRRNTLYLSRRIDLGSERLLAQGGGMTEQVEGLLDAIVIETQRSFDYYESHFSQPPVQGIVVAPLGADLPGMADYLSAQLGVPVRDLDLNAVLDMAEPLDAATQYYCLTAIGAALRAGDQAA